MVKPITTLPSCYNVEHDCKSFKTGKFSLNTFVCVKTTVFERNDSLEIETYDGKTDTASIRWINDCEYILKNYTKKHGEEKSIDMKILTTQEIRIPLNLEW
jgi:hypothetical protein